MSLSITTNCLSDIVVQESIGNTKRTKQFWETMAEENARDSAASPFPSRESAPSPFLLHTSQRLQEDSKSPISSTISTTDSLECRSVGSNEEERPTSAPTSRPSSTTGMYSECNLQGTSSNHGSGESFHLDKGKCLIHRYNYLECRLCIYCIIYNI